MNPHRRSLARFGAAALLALAAGAAPAQDAPIHLLVGFAPGGMTDVVGRVLAQGLQAELGRTVLVENRPGAGGQIAAQALKAARPDGNTLFLTNNHTTAMIPLTTVNPGYEARDFAAVGLVATNPNFFIVNPAVVGPSVDSVKAFVQWAKANPARGNIGVPAPASAPEFSVTVMGQSLGADLKPVAYRGDAPLVQDLLGGQIAAGISGISSALPHVKAGKLKLVAVDGPKRLAGFPDIPTYGELGIQGLDDVIFIGVVAPAGMPADLIARYNAAINKVVASRAFLERTSEAGIVPLTGTPEEMARRTEASRLANIPLVKAAGFKPQ
ncbi:MULTISPECIES: Bug family tripartite tricarboxylate transporter substrate binding protein [Ramlibacter]|uniref:ABC transporter substrate-binding protein n=1 Tax=Ramlibacter pinisoli TaxID=2682844 RepID=A0A6N8IN11_9BURK|nr:MULTISPECIES: Bug family tripartite tricarboxylate transporter substrate binding protein [Ramlibacter]MBA2963280.1 ABC transporter substrate-binding protein [Ramlibacter sp. CGMCC 1.13660]MVQ28247.1 ABC transporter substrate-binding protein [Ramlibacter pinisoli]